MTTGTCDNLEEFFLQNHLNLYKVCLSKSDSVVSNRNFYRTRNGTVSDQNGSFEFLAPNSTTAKSFKFFTAFEAKNKPHFRPVELRFALQIVDFHQIIWFPCYGERRKKRNRNTIPPMGVGVKKRATPSTVRITEAIVSRTAQISNRNTSRAARRDNAKAKGATNIFSSIFKTSFIYPSYLYFITPVREHKCCEKLVNPVLNLFSNKNGWSNETIRF